MPVGGLSAPDLTVAAGEPVANLRVGTLGYPLLHSMVPRGGPRAAAGRQRTEALPAEKRAFYADG